MMSVMSFLAVHCLLFSVILYATSSHPIVVKIEKPDNVSRNLNPVSIEAKTRASDFSGPTSLAYLVGNCFSHSSDKYEYRVCPFANITQHERAVTAAAYSGLIGVWKEWSLKNHSFDSLVFLNGDDCGERLERTARLVFVCNRQLNRTGDSVVDVKEPKKCFYEIGFASDFGCADKHIYQYLNEEAKQKWDQIETNFFHNELTEFGYELSLNELFVENGIIVSQTNATDISESADEHNCRRNFDLLRQQNVELIKRIEFLENELTNKSRPLR